MAQITSYMDNNNDKTVQVNIQEYKGGQPIEVVLRQGAAAKAKEPLPTKEPLRWDFEGVLNSPLEFIKSRNNEFEHNSANVIACKDDAEIVLIIDEEDPYHKGVITGKLETSDIFDKFRINSSEGWTPAQLGQFIRLNRYYFDDKQEAMVLISTLKNFSASCKSEIQKMKDPSGSMAEIYRMEVETNLPKSFAVSLPVFKGGDKVTIEVEFDHYVLNNDVYLMLVSPGANEYVQGFQSEAIDKVLDGIREVAPDILILEK